MHVEKILECNFPKIKKSNAKDNIGFWVGGLKYMGGGIGVYRGYRRGVGEIMTPGLLIYNLFFVVGSKIG